MLRPSRGRAEHPELVEVWRSAVAATHDFVDAADLARIERHLATSYFPAVSITCAERDGRLLGFSGTAAGRLEMLFVRAEARGQGVGTALLAASVAEAGVTAVDVNEQNSAATGFYLSRGFVQIGRSELDGDGRPYPILHLELHD